MKDIGYYAGFLSTEEQSRIMDASIGHLASCLGDVAQPIYTGYYIDDDSCPAIEVGKELISEPRIAKMSAPDLLAVIRGICDRIEVKLMEEAK